MIALLKKDFRVYRAALVAWVLLVLGIFSLPFIIGMLMLLLYFSRYGLIALGLTICLMIALLKKRFGLFRAAFIVLLTVFIIYLAGYATALVIVSIGHRSYLPEIFPNWGLIGQGFTICMAAAFGGCAFAIERRDRSAEFLAMMPVSRRRIVASKIILSAVPIFMLWIIVSTLLYLNRAFAQESIHEPFFWAYAFPGTIILLVFGVSWLFSVLIKSPSISACLGLAMLIILAIAWGQMHAFIQTHVFKTFLPETEYWIAAFAVLIGASCVLAGTFIYTQRVSP